MKSRIDVTSQEIDQIINDSIVCHVSMIDKDGLPYVLPFNFGYKDGRLFIHCAPEGKKIEAWSLNPKVCVAFSTSYEMRIQNEKVACSYSMRYRSVLIHGEVKPIINYEQKLQTLNLVMEKYTSKSDFSYNRPSVDNVKVFEVIIGKVEGRIYGY